MLLMAMPATAAMTSASSPVISLVRRDVRSDRSRKAPQGWLAVPIAAISGRREPQHVSHAAQGVDQPRFLGIDLAAQDRHVRLDDARVTAEVVVPHVVQDLHLG